MAAGPVARFAAICLGAAVVVVEVCVVGGVVEMRDCAEVENVGVGFACAEVDKAK